MRSSPPHTIEQRGGGGCCSCCEQGGWWRGGEGRARRSAGTGGARGISLQPEVVVYYCRTYVKTVRGGGPGLWSLVFGGCALPGGSDSEERGRVLWDATEVRVRIVVVYYCRTYVKAVRGCITTECQ